MGVEMTDEEVWSFLAAGHTGILTTLRSSGFPVSVPVWFAVDGRSVLVAGPADTVKFRRIANDPRVCFLVEAGTQWSELQAVRMEGHAELVDQADWERVDGLMEAKYASARTPRAEMSESARRRYDGARALLRLTPTTIVSWDNRKLRS